MKEDLSVEWFMFNGRRSSFRFFDGIINTSYSVRPDYLNKHCHVQRYGDNTMF